MMKRSYKLKQRAETQERTHQKIVDAAIELHQEKGLAATSIGDIAERAQVGKVTVYRHFPDEAALLGACSGKYFERHPLPDPEAWRSIPDPLKRLQCGLRNTYRFHHETEPMMSRVLAEARDIPIMEPYFAHWRYVSEILVDPWPVSERNKRLLFAAISLALTFDTWQLLVQRQGLTDSEAIELMIRLTCDCLKNEA